MTLIELERCLNFLEAQGWSVYIPEKAIGSNKLKALSYSLEEVVHEIAHQSTLGVSFEPMHQEKINNLIEKRWKSTRGRDTNEVEVSAITLLVFKKINLFSPEIDKEIYTSMCWNLRKLKIMPAEFDEIINKKAGKLQSHVQNIIKYLQ